MIKLMIFFQIELEQILGLNQDLAPASYENANTIPNNNSKLKVGEKTDKNHKKRDETKLLLCANLHITSILLKRVKVSQNWEVYLQF